jgi:hypothetical protein
VELELNFETVRWSWSGVDLTRSGVGVGAFFPTLIQLRRIVYFAREQRKKRSIHRRPLVNALRERKIEK